MSEPTHPEVAVLNAALELREPDRSAYLDEACAGDAALRQRVEGLLRAHEQAEDFLEKPRAGHGFKRTMMLNLPPSEKPGDKIGRYKLLQQIGEGGCGVVYMAEQEEPVRRRVALKVIRLGMDTKSVIARFEAERQALALMDHPNIAKVLDAGATETGRPYFVMELVRGIKITDYCDENKVATEDRLKLFIQVCQAIQHAHQKGIIHRDIKPSNILVTVNDGVPVPKVIDFGIAKATQGRLTDKTVFTAFEQFLGTPAYMSPEQAVMTSLDIDTRSDIYSLGVLLYELLTGKTPFDAKELLQAGLDEMRRTILEAEPPKPSTRLSTMLDAERTVTAIRRQTDPPKLMYLVRGDLDWIVMKSLEKDRARRYETANGFAADIQRHLTNEPVNACPPSSLYRLQKAVRRNKGVFAAVTAILVVLLTGVVVSTSQAIRARQAEREQVQLRQRAEAGEKKAKTEAIKSEQTAKFLKNMLRGAGPSVARGRDPTLLREILDKAVGRVDVELKDQPEARGDLQMTLGSTYSDIGDLPRAVTNFQQATDSYRLAFGGDNVKLAFTLGFLGQSQSFLNELGSGEKNARLGLEMARRCGDPETLASCLASMASSFNFYAMGSTQGVPYIREAIALRQKLTNNPVALASCMEWLACCLDDNEEGESMVRQALALHRQALGTDHPRVAADLQLLGQKLIKRSQFKEAEAVLREAEDLFERIADPNDPYQAISLRFLAVALIHQGKQAEAESIVRQTVDKFPSNAECHELFGRLEISWGKWELAAEQLTRAVDLKSDDPSWREIIPPVLVLAGRNEEYYRLRHGCLEGVAGVRDLDARVNQARAMLLLPGDHGDLERACQYADAVADSTDIEKCEYAKVIKALVEYRRGRFDSAQDWSNRAVSPEDTWLPSQAESRYIQALVCVRLGQMESAQVALLKGDELVTRFEPYDPVFWAVDKMNIARVLGREARAAIESQPASAPGK
jgi:eukaryotic-like serine/threonine-protein kinase